MAPASPDTPASDAEGRGRGKNDRGQWANKTEFRLAMAGVVLGLDHRYGYGVDNLWRFPEDLLTRDGSMFFIPYLLFLFFFGLPVYFLETALGQFTGESPFTAWRKICPIFQGIGMACQVLALYHSVSGMVVTTWTLFYLYNSFKSPLPWASCQNVWNTDDCKANNGSDDADFWSSRNVSSTSDYHEGPGVWRLFSTPPHEFWTFQVVGEVDWYSRTWTIFPGLSRVRWGLVICLLLCWVLCFLCVFKGIKYIGKLLYFTVLFPLLLLVILFLRGVTLPGAWQGIGYFFHPERSAKLHSRYPHIFSVDMLEALNRCAVFHGVLTTIGSYNTYKHNCYKDCLVFCGLNAALRVFTSIIAFSLVGFGAHVVGQKMLIDSFYMAPLNYYTLPRLLSLLPASQFWCALYFLMSFFFDFTSQFLLLESLITTVTDIFPTALRKRHAWLTLAAVVVCFLLGLPMVMTDGLIIIDKVGLYGMSGTTWLFIVCLQVIVIGWIYGADRFFDNVEDMSGCRAHPVLKYCLLFVCPLCCLVSIILRSSSSWLGIRDRTRYVSALLMVLPPLCIPVFILAAIYKSQDGVVTPAGDLRQTRPDKPPLSLCGRIVLAGSKPDGVRRESGEKAPAERTTGV